MNLAFFDFLDWDYDAGSVFEKPMGGSQSALCYLSMALAARGHQVTLYSSTTRPRVVQGVDCRSCRHLGPGDLAHCDAVVVLNGPGDSALTMRSIVSPSCNLILWTQHLHDQADMIALNQPAVRAGWDLIVCVSRWHRETMIQQLGLDPAKTVFMRNAIGPAFANMFENAAALASAKTPAPSLVYTSTPFRGLEVLLAVFPMVRERFPLITLDVFSSMRVYGADLSDDPFARLYEKSRSMPGVRYCGSVPQVELAAKIKPAWLLAYPCIFAETSCIAAMEAMAAGLGIATAALGALPETTMGFAALSPILFAPTLEQARRFTAAYCELLLACLDQIHRDPRAFWNRRWEQVQAINQSSWAIRASEWENLLA